MESVRVERRLAAILAADIVGYSRLIEADERATLAAIKALRSDVIDPVLAEHKGRIVKLMGDGALVEFTSVVDAVACGVAIQAGVAAQQAEAPPHRRLVFRIGINLGDVVVEGDDLLGDGVNVAARLEQLCPPGGVLISGTAYDHMKGKLGLPIDFVGEQHVKNISEPVRTYRVRTSGLKPRWQVTAYRFRRPVRWSAVLLCVVLTASAAALWFRAVDTAIAKPTIAVLPFDNLSGDDPTSRLADGVTEDIITDLGRFPEFDVVAHNSTETYKNKAVDVRQVGKDLGVGFVLEGSLQRQGDQIRLTAQLIDARDGRHVWSERWDRPAADIFAVQTEIAEQVTNRIGGGAGLIQTAGREAARRKRPDNLSAYELYLLGTEKLEHFTKADVDESIRLLTRAVELDPDLARAWIELSHAYNIVPGFGGDLAAAHRLAMEAAKRAVTLDPGDAEAHAALAMRLGDTGEFVRAKSAFDTALNLSPGSAEILTFYAGFASTLGEPERGAEVVDRAIRLNPEYPMWASGPFSWAYFMAGRYPDAARLLERTSPESFNMFKWVILAGSYAAQGMTREAEATRNKALASFPNLTVESFISYPGMNDTERQKFADKMRLAGFPLCAGANQLNGVKAASQLPECTAALAQ